MEFHGKVSFGLFAGAVVLEPWKIEVLFLSLVRNTADSVLSIQNTKGKSNRIAMARIVC